MSNYPSKVCTSECVIFEKQTDSHAIASVTIPISGEYKVLLWSGKWVIRHFEAGETVDRLQKLVRSTCPGYSEIEVDE